MSHTIYILATTAASPNFFGVTQLDGAAPSTATANFGYGVSNTGFAAFPFWRSRLGASGTTTTTDAGSTDYLGAGDTGPLKGTGSTGSTAGDSFVAGPFNGTFAAAAWTFNWWVVNAGAYSSSGSIRMRVWKSANADGSSPTELTAGALTGAAVTPTTTAANSSISWSPGAITLNNEYLFFQLEWNATSTGTNVASVIKFRVGAAGTGCTVVAPTYTDVATSLATLSPALVALPKERLWLQIAASLNPAQVLAVNEDQIFSATAALSPAVVVAASILPKLRSGSDLWPLGFSPVGSIRSAQFSAPHIPQVYADAASLVPAATVRVTETMPLPAKAALSAAVIVAVAENVPLATQIALAPAAIVATQEAVFGSAAIALAPTTTFSVSISQFSIAATLTPAAVLTIAERQRTVIGVGLAPAPILIAIAAQRQPIGAALAVAANSSIVGFGTQPLIGGGAVVANLAAVPSLQWLAAPTTLSPSVVAAIKEFQQQTATATLAQTATLANAALLANLPALAGLASSTGLSTAGLIAWGPTAQLSPTATFGSNSLLVPGLSIILAPTTGLLASVSRQLNAVKAVLTPELIAGGNFTSRQVVPAAQIKLSVGATVGGSVGASSIHSAGTYFGPLGRFPLGLEPTLRARNPINAVLLPATILAASAVATAAAALAALSPAATLLAAVTQPGRQPATALIAPAAALTVFETQWQQATIGLAPTTTLTVNLLPPGYITFTFVVEAIAQAQARLQSAIQGGLAPELITLVQASQRQLARAALAPTATLVASPIIPGRTISGGAYFAPVGRYPLGRMPPLGVTVRLAVLAPAAILQAQATLWRTASTALSATSTMAAAGSLRQATATTLLPATTLGIDLQNPAAWSGTVALVVATTFAADLQQSGLKSVGAVLAVVATAVVAETQKLSAPATLAPTTTFGTAVLTGLRTAGAYFTPLGHYPLGRTPAAAKQPLSPVAVLRAQVVLQQAAQATLVATTTLGAAQPGLQSIASLLVAVTGLVVDLRPPFAFRFVDEAVLQAQERLRLTARAGLAQTAVLGALVTIPGQVTAWPAAAQWTATATFGASATTRGAVTLMAGARLIPVGRYPVGAVPVVVVSPHALIAALAPGAALAADVTHVHAPAVQQAQAALNPAVTVGADLVQLVGGHIQWDTRTTLSSTPALRAFATLISLHPQATAGGHVAVLGLAPLGSQRAAGLFENDRGEGQPSLAVGGIPAKGYVIFNFNPAAGDSLTINGTQITFIGILRGPTLQQTLQSLITTLQNSSDPNLQACTYSLGYTQGGTLLQSHLGDTGAGSPVQNALNITAAQPGSGGNSIPLSSNSSNSSMATSGDTLSGGSSGTFNIARRGDTSTHGGQIITAAQQSFTEGPQIARVTDILACPIHGPNPIITGSQQYFTEGLQTARTTSRTKCGAQIISRATQSFCA